MKDFWQEPEDKKLNKKKVIGVVIILLIILIFGILFFIYKNNRIVRVWVDKNIFQKEKVQNYLPSIEIEQIDNENIYAYYKYIGILNKNSFQIYDSTAKKVNSLQIEVSKPVFDSNNRYLVVGEKKGQKLYLIDDKDIKWERNIDGNISEVTVNKNGYVAVTIVDTSYKTVVALYDPQGEQLFNTYLSTTRVVATSISEDNKYLAIAEVDTSGTLVQSNIKIISIADGKNDPANSIKKIYSENNELVTNIKYQYKNRLLCMFTDKITEIKPYESEEVISEFKNKKIVFASVVMSNASVTVEEKSSGLFTADSCINIVNSDNKYLINYTADSVSKEINTYDNVIALNLGSEVEFISSNGWLIKKYIAEQEINTIVLSNSIAGIIYRDRIEIINL